MSEKSTPAFSLALTDEQQEVIDWVREFAQKHIVPEASKWDQAEETPWPIIQEAAKAGLYSFEFLAELTADPSGVLLPAVLEELAAADPGICMAIVGTTLAVAGIIANGTGEQIGEWTPRCFGTTDKPALAAFAVSEPDAGSDVSSLRTRAVYVPDPADPDNPEKGEYVLNGTKMWITNGGIADVHVVVASVDPELGAKGQASFVIGPNTTGLTQGSKIKKTGIKASHTAEVVLTDVRVPVAQLLGGKKKLDARLQKAKTGSKSGGQPAMATFESSRSSVGAMAVGIARGAYQHALNYAQERKQFGKPIIEHQLIAGQLADMATRIDAARLLVWRAGWMARNGIPFKNAEGSQAKLFASECAVDVTRQAVQILGGAGFACDHPVERLHRDSLVFTIFEGTSEIQKLIIASSLAGRRIR